MTKKIKSRDESIRKITKTGGYTYYVTLPKEKLETLGWREGEQVRVSRKGRRILVDLAGDLGIDEDTLRRSADLKNFLDEAFHRVVASNKKETDGVFHFKNNSCFEGTSDFPVIGSEPLQSQAGGEFNLTIEIT